MSLEREVFAARRKRFMERLPAGAAAIFHSAPHPIRSHDVEHRYRPDSDLYYLTGFPEPETVALFLPGHPKEEFVLFVRPRDPERETWTGYRSGVEGAIGEYGADMAYPIDKLAEEGRKYLGEREQIFFGTGRDETFGRTLLEWFGQWMALRPRTGAGPRVLADAGQIVHEMRLFKTEDELALMRRAIEVTTEAHVAAMRERRPGMSEHEIEALIEYLFRRGGGVGPAYPSIVAGGANATILHYTENNRALADGDLLLVDAGAELGYYCADITRTYPVGSRFTETQRALFDVVLEAQKAAIDLVAPGVRFDDVHMAAVRVLVQGLIDNGLLTEPNLDEAIQKELYKPFYMHRTSHWLGMDVHDVGNYKVGSESRQLEPGMVLTVEPGLYVSPANQDVAPQWLGIGIRIEDDVLVTAGGHEVLSAAIPKTPEGVA